MEQTLITKLMESREYGHRDPSRWPRVTLLSANVGINLADKRRWLSPDSGHGVYGKMFHSCDISTEFPEVPQISLYGVCEQFEIPCSLTILSFVAIQGYWNRC
jgi:hypothetical protein